MLGRFADSRFFLCLFLFWSSFVEVVEVVADVGALGLADAEVVDDRVEEFLSCLSIDSLGK